MLDSDATLAEAFAPGHVNPHHRQKATLVAYGFEGLTAEIARALRMAADGSAFEPTFDRTGATS